MFTFKSSSAPVFKRHIGNRDAGQYQFEVRVFGDPLMCTAPVNYVLDSKGHYAIDCGMVVNPKLTYDAFSILHGHRPLSEVLEEQSRLLLLAIGDK
jgi:hypothetical protein